MLKIAFNTILGMVLIFVWLKFVNLSQIFETLSHVSIINLLPAFIFMLLSPAIRALRLKVFLGKIKNIKLLDLIFLNGVAMMLNFFIPIRAGEIAKGIFLHTRYDLSLAKSIVWIFIDRFVDFLAVLGLAAVLVWGLHTKLNMEFALSLALMFLTGLAVAYLIAYQKTFTMKIFKFLRPLLISNRLKIYFDNLTAFFLDAFSVLKRSPKDISLLIILTIAAYAADAVIWYFVFLSLRESMSFFAMYLGQLLSALTYLIPAAPGYVGSAEASGLLVLSGVLGIEPNLASAMTVLFHITSALFVIIFGLISVFNLKMDLGLILRKALRK